ncbi:hypothetical protein GCM10027289_02970 [Tsukamurella serpentis]
MAEIDVRLGPCVGGRLRTWTADGAGELWSVPHDHWLRTVQATGALSRTETAPGRFAEAGTLTGDGAILVRPRLPVPDPAGRATTMAPQRVRLDAPRRASRATFEDFRELLVRAVNRCVDAGEFLVIEPGAADDDQRFALFAVMPHGADRVVVVETAPAPASELWSPFVDPAGEGHTISAPMSASTVEMVPTLLTEAIRGWHLDPWDLVLTFGQH